MIELLVVIVILGILMAVALPTFLRQQNKAKDSEARQYLTTAYKVAKGETVGNNGQYPAVASLVSALNQSEPELTFASGAACSASTGPKNLIVLTSSTSSSVTICDKSNSGHLWQVAFTTTGSTAAPTFTDLGAAPAGYSATILADSPAGYWRFNESSGTTATAAAGGINGIYTGGFTLAQSGATTDGNKAVSLDGTSGYVNLGNNFGFTGSQSFSLEIWVNPANLVGTQATIFNKQTSVGGTEGSYIVYLQNSLVVFFRDGDSSHSHTLATPSAVTAGSWYYIVATYDAPTGAMSVYVNGVLQAKTTDTTPMNATTQPLMIGAGTYGGKFPGLVDEAAVYSTALTCGTTTVGQACTAGSQIYTHYNAR